VKGILVEGRADEERKGRYLAEMVLLESALPLETGGLKPKGGGGGYRGIDDRAPGHMERKEGGTKGVKIFQHRDAWAFELSG